MLYNIKNLHYYSTQRIDTIGGAMKAIVLAGGKGTRLWPLSRESFPKQFLSMREGPSLLQKTVTRLHSVVKPEDIYVITNHANFHDVDYQLLKVSKPSRSNIIIEPEGRNTAPAIALGVKYLRDNGVMSDDDICFVTPSDHLIFDDDRFAEYLSQAGDIASKGHIVAFGITPQSPETGYGYIKKGKALNGNSAFSAEAFVEKPDEDSSRRFVDSGNYYWNSGMFTFSYNTIVSELKEHAPFIHQAFTGSMTDALQQFSSLPNISIDYAVMEKSERVAVLPVTLDWSDVGSWDSLYKVLEKDDNANVTIGDVLAEDTHNSFILGDRRLIATVGLEDTLVVDTPDALFITKKGQSQKVRDIVASLKKDSRPEIVTPSQVHRSWGSIINVEKGSDYLIRRLVLNGGSCLTLQTATNQNKHWVCIKGCAKVTVGGKTSILKASEGMSLPPSTLHKLENIDTQPLHIIETKSGEKLEDEDIVNTQDALYSC